MAIQGPGSGIGADCWDGLASAPAYFLANLYIEVVVYRNPARLEKTCVPQALKQLATQLVCACSTPTIMKYS